MDLQSLEKLNQESCRVLKSEPKVLSTDEISGYLKLLPEWKTDDKVICCEISFNNYYETTAFVNAVVWVAHSEDHHPDISFGYKKCRVTYSTHSAGGITVKDFICAAKISRLAESKI